MIRRAGCAELAELRSAYVDGALADRDRERLLAHLVGCAACRADIEDLRRVRLLLAAPADPQGAPGDLSSRLISIAGENPRAQRKWMAARTDPRRPRQHHRARVALATMTALGVGLFAVTGIGYLAAPPVTASTVADPSAEAVREYGGMLASLPLTNQSVDAMAAIQPTQATVLPSGRPMTPSGVARRLSAEEARDLLRQAALTPTRLSFTGIQSYQAVRGEKLISATVEVVSVAGQGTQLRVLDRAGREVSARFVGVTPASRLTELSLVSLLRRHYDLSGVPGSEVAGRSATVIEARPQDASSDASVAARWWVDDSTGLLLWQETYDDRDRLQSAVGFRDVTFRGAAFLSHLPQAAVPRTTTALTLAKTTDLAAQGWSPPAELAGLPLVRLRSDRADNPQALHLVYSDGLSVVSVFEQRGGMRTGPPGSDWNAGVGAFVRWGSASTASWQSGETVMTVVSNSSPELLAEAVQSLPHVEVPRRTTMEAILAGWSRILGLR